MSLLYLSWRNMISRPLTTALVLLLMTLGIGMISLIMNVSEQVLRQFNKNAEGIDMVVGAKGSPLQLILASVYHIDNPTGNIKLAEAEALKKNRLVAQGIPLSYGDSYRGYRIVGTTPEYPELYAAAVDQGGLWKESGEVTVGWEVATANGLKIGDEIVSEHGLIEGGEVHGEHKLRVVGIFAPNGSVIDQLILTNLQTVWDVHAYEGEDVEDTDRDITAMIIKFRGPMGIIRLPRMINEDTNMQAALPAFEVSKLMGMMGIGIDVIRALGLLIMLVSGISVFISLYNAMKDRRYELALMRGYGATRGQLVWLVLAEGLSLSLIGWFLGMVFSRFAFFVVSGLFTDSYRYNLSSSVISPNDLVLAGVAIAIGLVASILPAMKAARLPISRVLADS